MAHGFKPGDRVTVTRTYLEMSERPSGPRAPSPNLKGLALIRAEDPPRRWFLHLYDSVGSSYEWCDWHERPAEQLEAFIGDKDVSIFTLMLQGWTAGFFMLDWREAGVAEIAYFGLTPAAVGRGLSRWMLDTAIHTGWDRDGVRKLTINTCTLDHPRAIALYQRAGFAPVERESFERVLVNELSQEAAP
ncbi:MAG: GNAT family N-acetyltransferase [Pseudomonadota bacterium]